MKDKDQEELKTLIESALDGNEYFHKRDSDDDVTFKFSNTNYVISLDEGEDGDPLYFMVFASYGGFAGNFDRKKMNKCALEASEKYKAVKIAVKDEDTVRMSIEMFLPLGMTTVQWGGILKRCALSLGALESDYIEALREVD